MRRLVLVIGAMLVLLPGCGKPPMIPVTGTVTLAGKPLPFCKVNFFPDVAEFDPLTQVYGYGITDADGKFQIRHPGGEMGIYPGTYRVTFVAWVDNKGNPIPFDAKPSEVKGGVKNLLPGTYESLEDTPERATVTRSGLDQTFKLVK